MPKVLKVTPENLEKYAKKQDAASSKAGEAAGATSGLGTDCWLYQGVISGVSNGTVSDTAKVRSAAGGKISAAAHSLAEKLRAAKLTYEGVDAQLADNLNKQLLDK
jgi:Excreted virulence factor EspC, type VII ESX diderm